VLGLFAALGQAQARYLVVGGVAVVLHGHPRFTADLDLVVALDPDNVRRVFAVPTFSCAASPARLPSRRCQRNA
jgi:hypothetical protein